jgi:hypothetical protein
MAKIEGNDFKLRYRGELNEIDADTLLKSLAGITHTIAELSNELGGGRVEIKIKALDRGSFLVHLAIIPESIKNLFSSLDIDNIQKLLSSLVNLLHLKKFLKGEKPDKVSERANEVEVTNNTGTIIVDKRVFHVYVNNRKLNDDLESTFKALKDDPAITGFEVTDPSDKPLFDSTRGDFEAIASRNKIIEENLKLETEKATVSIFKIVFEPEYKWEVVYEGNRIQVRITDQSFFKRINSGEKFAKGDSLEVELQIEKEFDSSANAYINRNYEIKKVLRHIPRGEQQRLTL